MWTPEQKALVREAFSHIRPVSETTAAVFYGRLFELNPDLQPLFRGSIGEQGRKLMEMFFLAVDGLDAPERLIPLLQALGSRHTGYGVEPEDYQTAAEAMDWTLDVTLGEAYTPAMRAAWATVYDWLMESMLAA